MSRFIRVIIKKILKYEAARVDCRGDDSEHKTKENLFSFPPQDKLKLVVFLGKIMKMIIKELNKHKTENYLLKYFR